MTITREQVADLREGDVVEITIASHPGYIQRGPVSGSWRLYFGPDVLRIEDGSPANWAQRDGYSLTVISRAPRPLYVNHDRKKPVAGDIARDRDGDAWRRGEALWFLTGCDEGQAEIRRDYHPLTLLWDGETGQVVP